ncbi:MAG: DEAD/DEAH box helicase [Bacteroidales bacterium]|nr:DEAD/DEAH box helicase [Bacteroidales bacterium]
MPGSDSSKRVPYSRKPEDLSLDEWQAELRKQFASEQKFKVKNIGDHPVYSDFEVFNQETDKTYKVSVRDNVSSYHYCSCPDFKVNTLGTCKHVEYVLLQLLRYKKYQKYFTRLQKNSYSSLSILYGHKRLIRLKKGNGSVSYEDVDRFFDDRGFLLPGMIFSLDNFIRSAVKADPAFRVYPDVFEFISRHKRNQDRKDRLMEIIPDGAESEIFDNLVRTRLYPYQKKGIIDIIRAGRVLLADDMGLGKTIEAIAAVEIFTRYFDVRRVLVICPTSLKYQWKAEIRKFSGRNACVVEGLIHKRKELYGQDDFYKIISYGIVRNDTKLINEWAADLVIVDEAQRIKNWKTQTAKAVKKIHTEYTIVATGTPLENRIDELHSIVEYIDMYKLGPLFRFLDNHQVLDEHGKLIGYKDLRTINKTLEDILIRRTKDEIADQLPGRIDKNFFVEMTPEQKSDHKDYYDVVARLANRWILQGYLSEEERQNLLICLNCMRMVSDSTYILNAKTNSGNKISELKSLIREVTEDKSNKLLIFSQWKRMFNLLIRELDKLDMEYVYLNGDVPARQRKEIIDRFQNDQALKLFLSTDAGGVGVNLQSANILVNIDLPWNPAVLEQRIGRIYRLGQKKHIQVYNFIAEGSIEHRILYLLDFKKNVFKGVMDEGGEDRVMIEGFLQSVKAMLDVNMEDPDEKEASYDENDKPYSQVAEFNAPYQKDQPRYLADQVRNQGQEREHDSRGVQEESFKKGIFSVFRNRIIRLIKRFSNFLSGGEQ